MRQSLDRSGPAVRKLVAESGVDVGALTPTGPGGRLTKADVIAARASRRLRQCARRSAASAAAPPRTPPSAADRPSAKPACA